MYYMSVNIVSTLKMFSDQLYPSVLLLSLSQSPDIPNRHLTDYVYI